MATKVAGELYESLVRQLFEIGRQLHQKNGYPFDPEMLQLHLQNAIVGRFVFGGPKLLLTKSFDPVEFIGGGWKIVEEDPCSSALKEVEVGKFLFETCLKEGESGITGEEKLRRLKEKKDFVPFGVNVFLPLWEDYKANKDSSVLEWLFLNKGVKFMDFSGTVLRGPNGYRYVLDLYRYGDGHWDVDDPSVGCASSPLVSES